MKKNFYRIAKLPPYVFAEVNAKRALARSLGKDIIDLGMGNPDSTPPAKVIDKLTFAAQCSNIHGYSVSRGIKGLRKAQAEYYQRRFGVEIDYEKELIVNIGSKEGLSSLALAMTGPGDDIIVPNPSYPIHSWGFIIAGANVINIENLNYQRFFTLFKEYVAKAAKKPLAVVINYPNNPTSEVANLEFYEEIVDFCKFHNIYIISDLAYAEIYFSETPPPSIFQVKGAKDIAVEFTSLSKSFSMAGWRIGFTVGNRDLISAVTKIKSYLDYGIFTPMQIAATVAINESMDYIPEVRRVYKERRDILVTGLRQSGWDVPCPDASMFIWTRLPKKYQGLSSLDFSKLLLEKAEVAVSPGNGFGDMGEGYVRISLVENKNRIRQAIKNIKKFLHE
jgi:alanine-synthesizing transaminase